MNIHIAYLGGGSKAWARIFMNDLALRAGLSGEIRLYDIDLAAAYRNQAIGMAINQAKKIKSRWDYVVSETIQEALNVADFVIISILPGTFETMAVDVHFPECVGIWQPVGDTTGPGGVLRSMRTVPIFEAFADEIKQHCPNAWVINLTNPLAICVKTLHDRFPNMKVFGCCHEVFNAQNFLVKVIEEELKIKVDRRELFTDVSGINHFTWITKASYRDHDLLAWLPRFIESYFDSGINADGPVDMYQKDPMKSANRVKMDLFRQYGALGAAGDRHLAEFLDPKRYCADPETVKSWSFALTPVSYRIHQQQKRIEESIRIASGNKRPIVKKSKEEAVDLMLALLGEKRMLSNVNMPNIGQMPTLKKGAVVETNAYFLLDSVVPLVAGALPGAVEAMVQEHSSLMEQLYEGIKQRDLESIFHVFRRQPQCLTRKETDMRALFRQMVMGTRAFLDPYYDLSGLDERGI